MKSGERIKRRVDEEGELQGALFILRNNLLQDREKFNQEIQDQKGGTHTPLCCTGGRVTQEQNTATGHGLLSSWL